VKLPKKTKNYQKLPKTQKISKNPKNPIPRENQEFGIGFIG
jgi:hypothetical protein